LTEDQSYFVVDDELDEQDLRHGTRTRVFDVRSLTAPRLVRHFDSTAAAIDRNQYVKNRLSYQANYRAGLRILDVGKAATAEPAEVGFFDIYPENDAAEFNGAWSVYPYFASGTVVVSGIEHGLFVLRPTEGSAAPEPPPLVGMHVGDLEATAVPGKGGRWDATVTTTVHDESEMLVAGATVTGSWSGGASATGSCTAGTDGTCAIVLKGIPRTSSSATFTVDGVSSSGYAYDSTANHDPDGDSDGTSITVTKP
jgi:hypothetical protein